MNHLIPHENYNDPVYHIEEYISDITKLSIEFINKKLGYHTSPVILEQCTLHQLNRMAAALIGIQSGKDKNSHTNIRVPQLSNGGSRIIRAKAEGME